MSNPQRLVIIGGVAGGATAAARARRLSESARIVVLERGPYVSFANCGLPYHIGGEIAERGKLLLQTPKGLKARYGLDVRVRHEALSIDRTKKEVVVRDLESDRTYRESYDILILSTGAAPIRPPLPGIDHPRIFTLRSVPDTDAIKKAVDDSARTAVVVGGGFIGLEMAENLRRRGLSVHLVEMLDQVMPPLDREMATALHQTLALHGVQLHLGAAVEAFGDEGGRVSAKLKSGETLTADLVVLAIGVRPESKLAEEAGLAIGERGAIVVDPHLRTTDPDIYAVGDAVAIQDTVTGRPVLIPLAGPANRQARIAADHIFGRDSRYRGTQGTSIVRVFDLTAAMTGASEKTLRRAGLDFAKVYLHPAQHVGYYPGSEAMHLKLLFRPGDGRVLGAQITGRDGVDKRIDVLAMAIQAGFTVYDLEEAELAYSPQYGAAKDPVNMAGFVAANLLRGDVQLAYAEEPLGDAVLLDVREPGEHQAGAIPGSRLIPLGELRARHEELPWGRRIVAYCAVGMRGYVAARLLTQLGYDVANLSGGYRTWRMFHPDQPAGASAGGAGGGAAVVSGGCGEAGGGCAAPVERPAAASPLASVLSEGMAQSRNGMSPAGSAPPAPIKATTLDVRGQQCPGPILAMKQAVDRLGEGALLEVLSTDGGFCADVPAWCRQTGHELLGVAAREGYYVATIRKRTAPSGDARVAAASSAPAARDGTIVVFSNDLDRVLAAFVIANGTAAMGRKVTLFFTFWGLNALRRKPPQPVYKSLVDRMFGWMMPRGPEKLKLSKMHMAGMGTAMMKQVMRQKNIASLPELMRTARQSGVRLVACSMSMDVMGIRREELIDGVDIGGVGAYLNAADEANVNLFI